jgi:hypothetical protein
MKKPRRRMAAYAGTNPEVLPTEMAETAGRGGAHSLRARCFAALPFCLALIYLTLSYRASLSVARLLPNRARRS